MRDKRRPRWLTVTIFATLPANVIIFRWAPELALEILAGLGTTLSAILIVGYWHFRRRLAQPERRLFAVEVVPVEGQAHADRLETATFVMAQDSFPPGAALAILAAVSKTLRARYAPEDLANDGGHVHRAATWHV